MNITETARKNHEELFPNHQSSLKDTDPELIEIFDNFAFDEVLQYGTIDKKIRLMLILGSTIATQALTEYKIMLEAAYNVGVTAIEIKEITYQAVPYLGIAKVIDYIYASNEFLKSKGVKLPLDSQSTTDRNSRYEKGLLAQKEIFGDMIDKMHEFAPKDQVHIQQYLSANCFGDYYTRNGLDLKIRELLTFSIILSLGGCEPQLKGHIQGNRNIGNGKDILLAVVTQLLPYVGYPRTLNAIACINDVIPE